MAKKVQYSAVGRRKSSVARVILTAGTGEFVINDRQFEEYIPSSALRLDVLQPLELTETTSKFDISVNVYGGGVSGQEGAIRLGITRALMLANPDYIDESQEFDHIVVGKSGIILIETKNYAGTITVSSYGDWIQTKKGERKGIKNPVQQCDRHEALMRSIVGMVPITSVICLANDGVIVENRENCDLPIVNVSLLQRFIERMVCEEVLEDWKIDEIVKVIESHKVNKRIG